MRLIVVICGSPAWADEAVAHLSDRYLPKRYVERERYVARLADDHAALILVDGDVDDWRFWTVTPKSSPATRRISLVLVSADAARRAEGLLAGADVTVTPSALLEQLPTLFDALARMIDPAQAKQLDSQCAEPMPPEGKEALAKFNAGEFYKQHDIFEALWAAEPGAVRDLYRAILQVGIAYYQITRGNQRGALKMLLRSVQWLALLPDVCRGVDVAQLKADAARVRAELERVGPDGLAQFDRSLLKPVRIVEDA